MAGGRKKAVRKRFDQVALFGEAFERDARRLPVLDVQKDIRYYGAPAKSVLNGPETTGMGFWSINPYVGCAFGCAYCYARYAHRYVMERAADDAVGEHTPEQLLTRATLDVDLQAALDALPDAFRQAVWLRDVEELSYAEIAQVLQVPIGTVMSRISRGRRALYEGLQERRGATARRLASR